MPRDDWAKARAADIQRAAWKYPTKESADRPQAVKDAYKKWQAKLAKANHKRRAKRHKTHT